jgi:hypothetical protein
MVLVSAIYQNGPSSVIGGRGRNISFYHSTLRNLGNLNVPFVLYCDPSNVDNYREILSPIFNELHVFGFKLEDFVYYQEFISWKETFWKDIYLNDRNEVLCYSKLYFLKDVIDKKLFGDNKRYFWIDSGLTHHGLIPESIGGVELLTNPPADVYYPANPSNIFNPTFSEKLNNYIPQDKLFFCGHPLSCSNNEKLTELAAEMFEEEETKQAMYHIIGGIFGGNENLLIQLFDKYHVFLKKVIDNKIHVLEESILSSLFPYFEKIALLEKFSTWWFYMPGERNSMLTEEADSFYKIFTKIYEHKG